MFKKKKLGLLVAQKSNCVVTEVDRYAEQQDKYYTVLVLTTLNNARLYAHLAYSLWHEEDPEDTKQETLHYYATSLIKTELDNHVERLDNPFVAKAVRSFNMLLELKTEDYFKATNAMLDSPDAEGFY